ncbi:hypothetical protein L211DRAFT_854421 [Terfezia boudieri ATCC MYA-4762]|uniref:DNA 3'-5' helicase n=1 Tax=Terfezia boudieri ATCC MYA-4762 TaxID=1051890 RepID=A0A3N4L8P4_9PEZI|nr:hypothetical protein L211DRAFT_854421 [Terfezia boudieri ATCC MYA-4762]
MSDDARTRSLQEFLAGPSLITATGSLGAGLNPKDVRLVIHAGGAWSLIDFAQESGRAGRDGKSAKSIVLLNQSRDKCESEFFNYCMSGICRRFTLSSYLDGIGVDCWSGQNELCDICIANNPSENSTHRTEIRNPRQPLFRIGNSGLSNHLQIGTTSLGDQHLSTQQATHAEAARQLVIFKTFLKTLISRCIFCLMEDIPSDIREHTIHGCPYGGQEKLHECIRWKQAQLKLPEKTCWACGNPQWICPDTTPDTCQYRDTTILICYLTGTNDGLYNRVNQQLTVTLPDRNIPNAIKELLSWIAKPEQCFNNRLGHRGVNLAYHSLVELGLLS